MPLPNLVVESFGLLPDESLEPRPMPMAPFRMAEDRQPMLPADLLQERLGRIHTGGVISVPVPVSAQKPTDRPLELQVLYVPAPTPVQDVMAPPLVVQSSLPAPQVPAVVSAVAQPASVATVAPALPGPAAPTLPSPPGRGGFLVQAGRWLDGEMLPGVSNKILAIGAVVLVLAVALAGRGRD